MMTTPVAPDSGKAKTLDSGKGETLHSGKVEALDYGKAETVESGKAETLKTGAIETLKSEEVETLLTTWDKLKAGVDDMDGFCLAVVVRYLEKHPNMKYVFEAGKTKTLEEMKSDPSFTKHGELLHSSLDRVVRHLTAGGPQPEELRILLKDVGQKHVALGIRTPHYKPVGAELLQGMKEKLGSSFTPQVEALWGKAYGLIVDLMNVEDKTEKPNVPVENGSTTTDVPAAATT